MAKFWFSKVLTAAAILAATSLVGVESSQAQMQGYPLGIGFGYGQQNSVRFISPREDLPYFAKFPPVYYGDMVRRPYGISPYAVPPGIMPAEFSVPASRPCAKTIVNPYVPANPVLPQLMPHSNELPKMEVTPPTGSETAVEPPKDVTT